MNFVSRFSALLCSGSVWANLIWCALCGCDECEVWGGMGYADFNLTSSIFVPGSILLSPNSLWILWISQSQGDWWVSWYLPLLLRIHKKSEWDYRNKIQTREKNTLFTDPSLHFIFIATHSDFEWMMCGCVRSINRLVHKVINHYSDVWIHKHIHIEFWNNLLKSCSRWSI